MMKACSHARTCCVRAWSRGVRVAYNGFSSQRHSVITVVHACLSEEAPGQCHDDSVRLEMSFRPSKTESSLSTMIYGEIYRDNDTALRIRKVRVVDIHSDGAVTVLEFISLRSQSHAMTDSVFILYSK